jgi:hypothetical protein
MPLGLENVQQVARPARSRRHRPRQANGRAPPAPFCRERSNDQNYSNNHERIGTLSGEL